MRTLDTKPLRTPTLEYCALNPLLYLGKFVYLFHHCGKQSSHTLIYQTLHVVHRLLIWQVQPELILHLNGQQTRRKSTCYSFLRKSSAQVNKESWTGPSTCEHTFLTVLSGSSAMSGILASTMRENRFKMRFEYLVMTHTHTHVLKLYIRTQMNSFDLLATTIVI